MFGSMLAALVCASPVVAQQRPAASVASGVLAINYEACLARARQSLLSEGFTADRGVAGSANFYWGGKGIHWATIVCDGTPHADGKIDFHIWVASNSNDGNIPGVERVKLGNRMDQAVQGPTGLSVRTKKQIYAAGEEIVIEWSGLPGNQKDWFTIVKAGDLDTVTGQFVYSAGKRDGTQAFRGLASGQYEVRVYFNWQAGGYVVHARHQFTVQ